MRWRPPSRGAWTAVAAASALVAAVVAGFARPVVFDLPAGKPDEAAPAGDLVLDPRPFWARVPPRLAPAQALRLRLPRGAARTLDLSLYTAAGGDAEQQVTVAVDGTAVATVPLPPGARARARIPAPPRDGPPVELTLENPSRAPITWRRLRLVEAYPRFAWSHLGRAGRFPAKSAPFLALALGALLARAVAPAGGSRVRRLLAAAGPGAALALLAAALVLPGDAPLAARVPRAAWLALPWIWLPFGRPAREAPAPVRARALALNALLALTGLAVSLGIAELGLRLVFRDVTSAADTRSYFHRPGPFHENAWGFREREVPMPKPGGTYRLAVIGDSLTYGGGVPVEARFSNLLERRLNERAGPGRRYEVFNFGRPGWNTRQQVRVLRGLVLGTQPDFVLLQWYVNDVESRRDARRRPVPHRPIPSARVHRALMRGSALYALLVPQWARLEEALGLVEPHAAYMYRSFGDPDAPGSRDAMDQLREFVTACRRHGAGVGIVLFPRVGPDLVDGTYAYGYLHERVLEVCRDEGVGCVDLRTPFAAHADYQKLWVTPLDAHPSALANRIAADLLMATFEAGWLGRDDRTASGPGGPLPGHAR